MSSSAALKLTPRLQIISNDLVKKITLRESGYDEYWLQDYLKTNPDVLGIGKGLDFISSEKRQPRGGRLDLLFEDQDQIRFCVEVMLGDIDPSHIIRTIEYWDNERSRPGAGEHVAVLVAEGVANNRYLNVISVIAKAVPLIVIQMNCVQVEEKVAVTFSKILDHTEPLNYRSFEDEAAQEVDRKYWDNKSSNEAMKTVDLLFEIQTKISSTSKMKYNKHHIACGPQHGHNFMWHHPRKGGYNTVTFWIAPEYRKECEALIEKMDIDGKLNNRDTYQATVTVESINKNLSSWEKIIQLCITSS